MTYIQDPPNLLPFEENNPAPKKNLRREAERFIAEHPEVYALFKQFAMQLLATRRRFGISLLTERVRWEVFTTWATDDRGLKINNNHRPYIARKLIEDEPRLADLIQCRVTVY